MAVDFILKCASKIGGNKVFRPKQAVLAENSVSAETPKREKTEMPKPKQAEIYGRNQIETVLV